MIVMTMLSNAEIEACILQGQNVITPALKWVGAKNWMIDRLIALYQPHRHRRLVEPFVGSMAVALGLCPERALLNDVNPHLINFHERLRDPRPFELKMENDEALYYAYRTCFNEMGKTPARYTRAAAELFYYLNRTGFNGLCRFNQSGEFNVPYGKYDSITYQRDFSRYAEATRRWELCCGSFETVPVESTDFVYLDPPYDGTFTDYSEGGFSWEDQEKLAHKFAAHPGPIVASNQFTERVFVLYASLGFEVTILTAPRMISSNGNRQPAQEILATKNL